MRYRNINDKGMQLILRQTAARLGYVSTRGPIPGAGNPSAMIEGMGRGEIIMTKLSSQERQLLSDHLDFGLKFSKKKGEDLEALRAIVSKVKEAIKEPEPATV